MNDHNPYNNPPLPPKGTKIKFVKPIKIHWFNNIVEDQKLLEVGRIYTVEKVEMASSATYIWLQEFPPFEEGNRLPFFSYHSFEIVNENQ
jgi:hypothetical protein